MIFVKLVIIISQLGV